MKKEKKVRTYQRRTKSGKTITVRAHTASYEAADKAKEAAKKKGAGDEFSSKVKKGDEWKLPMNEFLDKLKEERAKKREDEKPKNVEDEKPKKKSEKKSEKKTPAKKATKKRTVGTGTNGPEPKKKATTKKTAEKADTSEPAFTRDEFKEWYRGTGSAADKKVAKALRKQLGRSGYRKFEDEAIDNYTSRGHLSMFKRVSGGSSASAKAKSASVSTKVTTKSSKAKKGFTTVAAYEDSIRKDKDKYNTLKESGWKTKRKNGNYYLISPDGSKMVDVIMQEKRGIGNTTVRTGRVYGRPRKNTLEETKGAVEKTSKRASDTKKVSNADSSKMFRGVFSDNFGTVDKVVRNVVTSDLPKLRKLPKGIAQWHEYSLGGDVNDHSVAISNAKKVLERMPENMYNRAYKEWKASINGGNLKTNVKKETSPKKRSVGTGTNGPEPKKTKTSADLKKEYESALAAEKKQKRSSDRKQAKALYEKYGTSHKEVAAFMRESKRKWSWDRERNAFTSGRLANGSPMRGIATMSLQAAINRMIKKRKK